MTTGTSLAQGVVAVRRLLVVIVIMAMVLVTGGSGRQPSLASDFPHGVIRLHIRPSSDAAADQALKLAVRDALLADLGPLLAAVDTPAVAHARLTRELSRVEDIATAELIRRGSKDPVRVSLGRAQFPTRTYGNLTLPAGEYEALQVLIGPGVGDNWWCVLFPSLCLVDGTMVKAVDEGEEESGDQDQEERPRIRFKILEVLGLGKN